MKIDTKISKQKAQIEIDKINKNPSLNDEQKIIIFQNQISQLYKQLTELDTLRKHHNSTIRIIQKEISTKSKIGWKKFQS